MDMRTKMMALFFALIAASMIYSFSHLDPIPGVSGSYLEHGVTIAPNVVATILFDFRGYDTLGECVILVSGVLALSIIFGKGLIEGDVSESQKELSLQSSLILKSFGKALLPLLVGLGIFITLGGHISPGGGFQGGSIIAAGFFIAFVLVGFSSVRLSHNTLSKMESLGLLTYIILGVVGLYFSGSYLANTPTQFTEATQGALNMLNYPDGLNSGLIPYLNIAVMIKVSAGLTTALLILSRAKND